MKALPLSTAVTHKPSSLHSPTWQPTRVPHTLAPLHALPPTPSNKTVHHSNATAADALALRRLEVTQQWQHRKRGNRWTTDRGSAPANGKRPVDSQQQQVQGQQTAQEQQTQQQQVEQQQLKEQHVTAEPVAKDRQSQLGQAKKGSLSQQQDTQQVQHARIDTTHPKRTTQKAAASASKTAAAATTAPSLDKKQGSDDAQAVEKKGKEARQDQGELCL